MEITNWRHPSSRRWSARQVPFFRTLRQDGTAACYLQGNHLRYLTTCPPAEVCSLRIRRQPNAGGRQASSECRRQNRPRAGCALGGVPALRLQTVTRSPRNVAGRIKCHANARRSAATRTGAPNWPLERRARIFWRDWSAGRRSHRPTIAGPLRSRCPSADGANRSAGRTLCWREGASTRVLAATRIDGRAFRRDRKAAER